MSMFAALCCALLLKLAHGQPRNASDYRVEGLEDIEPAFAEYKGGMYAGTIPVESWSKPLKEGHGELMFWYFDTHKPVHDDTLVIWFNGGPGCSSFDAGLLFEIVSVSYCFFHRSNLFSGSSYDSASSRRVLRGCIRGQCAFAVQQRDLVVGNGRPFHRATSWCGILLWRYRAPN